MSDGNLIPIRNLDAESACFLINNQESESAISVRIHVKNPESAILIDNSLFNLINLK